MKSFCEKKQSRGDLLVPSDVIVQVLKIYFFDKKFERNCNGNHMPEKSESCGETAKKIVETNSFRSQKQFAWICSTFKNLNLFVMKIENFDIRRNNTVNFQQNCLKLTWK
jgi:hypothetical protein